MDLGTTYLGLKLAHPLVPGASPLADDLDTVRRLEDAGAPAIVLRSLFAEQIAREQVGAFLHLDRHGESFAEHDTWFSGSTLFNATTRVPLIVSFPNKLPRQRVIAAPAMSVDLAPTVLDTIGAPIHVPAAAAHGGAAGNGPSHPRQSHWW